MDTPPSEDLEYQIQSFAAISMNPEYYSYEPQVPSLPAAVSVNPEYSDHFVASHSGPTSLADQAFSSPLLPPTKTRRKELFVEPMSGENDPQSMHPPAEGSRTSLKRKRSPSMDPPSNTTINPLQETTEMRAIDGSDTPSTSSQDRKGKGKATELKGKGKQRELVHLPTVLPKPLSEPLSEYTCPICFSAPTNATLTPCGHICCGACLFTAVKTVMQRAQTVGAPDANEARCPVCRAIIPDWDGYGGGVIGLKVWVGPNIASTTRIYDLYAMSESKIPSVPGPSTPLKESYTYHSPTPTAKGPYILGVDEAGRGPVLGPLVYGIAYCPVSYQEQLEELGFADSKTLNAETRSGLLDTLSSDTANLAWSVRVLCPQAISSGMLRRPPTNLNRQSQDATVLLIREVLATGIELSEVYVDALGTTTTYEKYLSSLFPSINFTVTTKADSKFKIVGAASVAAKVTRDCCIEGWHFEESETDSSKTWSKDLGSGYPSDPNTQAWLKGAMDPVFGFPKIVRFSWTTAKVVLEKDAHKVKWMDEGQASLIKAFESGRGLDKDRCAVARELHLRSIDTL